MNVTLFDILFSGRSCQEVWICMTSEQAVDFDSQVLESRATEGSYVSAECKASLTTHCETNTEYSFKLGPFTGKFVVLDLWHVSASMFSCWTSIQSLHLPKCKCKFADERTTVCGLVNDILTASQDVSVQERLWPAAICPLKSLLYPI